MGAINHCLYTSLIRLSQSSCQSRVTFLLTFRFQGDEKTREAFDIASQGQANGVLGDDLGPIQKGMGHGQVLLSRPRIWLWLWYQITAGGRVRGSLLVAKSIEIQGAAVDLGKVMGHDINVNAEVAASPDSGISTRALYAEGSCSYHAGEHPDRQRFAHFSTISSK